MPTGIADFCALLDQLEKVQRFNSSRYSYFQVQRLTFAFLWERTRTVGLKQLVAEQLALVAERPDTFEVQYTSGGFGWVVVYLDRIDREELAELTYEAWRLTASAELVAARNDMLPH